MSGRSNELSLLQDEGFQKILNELLEGVFEEKKGKKKKTVKKERRGRKKRGRGGQGRARSWGEGRFENVVCRVRRFFRIEKDVQRRLGWGYHLRREGGKKGGGGERKEGRKCLVRKNGLCAH